MVVEDSQGVAILSVRHAELTLEIGLPELVALRPLEASERLALETLLLADTAVAMQDVVHGLDAGQPLQALPLQHGVDTPRTPARIFLPYRQNEGLHFLRCLVRAVMRPPAMVPQRFPFFVPGQPLIPRLPGDFIFPAQRAEIPTTPRRTNKCFSLFFHSFTLPRHLDHSLFLGPPAFILL